MKVLFVAVTFVDATSDALLHSGWLDYVGLAHLSNPSKSEQLLTPLKKILELPFGCPFLQLHPARVAQIWMKTPQLTP